MGHCLFFFVVHFPFVFDFVLTSVPELFACVSHAVLRQIFAALLGTFLALSCSVLDFFSVCLLEPSVSPFKLFFARSVPFHSISFLLSFKLLFVIFLPILANSFTLSFSLLLTRSLPINYCSISLSLSLSLSFSFPSFLIL